MAEGFHTAADACVIITAFCGLLIFVFHLGGALKELKPNGGSSVKDRVGKLEISQLKQTASLARIEEKLGTGIAPDAHQGPDASSAHPPA